ncbi:MAG: CaiB/BaiF CoA-transferase family protein [Myxococcota bacterium]
MSERNPSDAPLQGIVVVDLTWNLPGPYASMALQALGAEVVKVEPPKGDPARHIGGLFAALNEGKRVVTLDLRAEDGKRELEALVRRADVVLEGFRPGVAARLGCDAAAVHAVNPDAVFCSISAWGQEGPLRDLPGHDLNAQALAGVCHLGRSDDEHPHGLPLPVADLSASMAAVASIVAELYAREQRRAAGQAAAVALDVAMVDAVVSWAHTWSRVDLAADAARRMPGRARAVAGRWLQRLDRPRLHALPHYDVFRCADGRYLALGLVDEQHFWRALCEALGAPRLGRLKMPTRLLLAPALRRMIALRLRTASAEAWFERLGRAGVPTSPVLTPDEALRHPQIAARMVAPSGRVRAPLAQRRVVPRPIPADGGSGG